MDNPAQFIRFSGRLSENMTFESQPGWETTRLANRPAEGDGVFQLELLNAAGQVLVAVSPNVDFERYSTAPQPEMRFARVVAYIPLHPDGRELVFRRGDLLIQREPLAPNPPSLQIESLKPGRGRRVQISWAAKHVVDKPLTYNVVYLASDKRSFLVAHGLTKTKFTADLGHLPGGPAGRLAILATDGTRSSFAVSEPFPVAEKPPQIWIQTPGDQETLPAGQPVSLCGQALDVAGAGLPEAGLIWQVDGQEVARGTRLALAVGLEPGTHKVSLKYAGDQKTIARKTIAIVIADRTPFKDAAAD